MNKYFLTLHGRWQLSAHLELTGQRWGIGAQIHGHGPGVDPMLVLFGEIVLTLGPLHLDAQAELLSEELASTMRDMLADE